MKNLGIHQFPQDQHSAAYFIERPIGNYLVFADKIEQVNFDLISSKGGLYKQFLESKDNLNSLNQKLFSKFGSFGTGQIPKDSFDTKLPLQSYGSEYCDPQVKLSTLGQGQSLKLIQRKQKALFLSSDFYLTMSERILCQDMDVSDSIYEYFENENADFVFFAKYAKNPCLVLT